MAPIFKKTEETLKKAGHKVADGTKEVAHGTADVAKDVGHKTASGLGKVAGKLDITCDTCGKVMSPGGTYTRVIMGKQYQFCSVLCADNFKPVK